MVVFFKTRNMDMFPHLFQYVSSKAQLAQGMSIIIKTGKNNLFILN